MQEYEVAYGGVQEEPLQNAELLGPGEADLVAVEQLALQFLVSVEPEHEEIIDLAEPE